MKTNNPTCGLKELDRFPYWQLDF